MRFKRILLALAVSTLMCVQARADFSQFGTFSVIDGSGPGGTQQVWDNFAFTDPNPSDHEVVGIGADSYHNSSSPTASIFAKLGPGDTINQVLGPIIAAGTVYAGPQMEVQLQIPNTIVPNLTKIVQATLRYRTDGKPGSGYLDSGLLPIVNAGVPLDPIAGVETTATNGWTTLLLEWQFPQLYSAEWITLELRGVLLDSVAVETQCVPLPASVLLGLLGLGAAGRKLRQMC